MRLTVSDLIHRINLHALVRSERPRKIQGAMCIGKVQASPAITSLASSAQDSSSNTVPADSTFSQHLRLHLQIFC